MSVAVRARGLWKAYRDGDRKVEVLSGADLVVEPGTSVAIVGPSGSGKSTLLHLLGGLDRADRGSVEVGSQDVGALRDDALAGFRNRTLGFVFQFHELLTDFTALENVEMPGWIGGLDEAETRRRAMSLLEEVGLADRAEHFPSELSGGERQRVALSRALLMRPSLLLADEPTGNLDPDNGDRVFNLLLELQQRHRTTAVVVTHNPEIANRCGTVLALENGVLRPV